MVSIDDGENTLTSFNWKKKQSFQSWSGLNLIKLLSAYIGAYLSQVNGAKRLFRRLKVL